MTSRSQDFSRPRLELKYLVSIETAHRFVDRLGDVFVADSHTHDGSYRVNSLYFDTSELKAYWEKLDGEDPRHKIRIRYYRPIQEDSQKWFAPPTSYFIEAKHRHDQMVSKTRVQVSALPLVIGDEQVLSPRLRGLVADEDLNAAEELDRILIRRAYLPFVSVSYNRQAFFFEQDRDIRITVDTDVRALPPAEFLTSKAKTGLSILPTHLAVVEIKFYWAMPHWLREIAVVSGLELRRFSKYASALEAVYPTITSRTLRIAALRD